MIYLFIIYTRHIYTKKLCYIYVRKDEDKNPHITMTNFKFQINHINNLYIRIRALIILLYNK